MNANKVWAASRAEVCVSGRPGVGGLGVRETAATEPVTDACKVACFSWVMWRRLSVARAYSKIYRLEQC